MSEQKCGCCAGSSGQCQPPRRGFLFAFGAGAMTIGGVLASVPVVGYLFGGASRKYPQRWVDLGSPASFPAGETRFATFTNPITTPNDGVTSKVACWVRCISAGKFQVFAINCAHLGCPVRWFAQSKLFLCPCHGGAYYEDGSRASGPPPRGLFEYPWRVQGGLLQIDAGSLPGLQERGFLPEVKS